MSQLSDTLFLSTHCTSIKMITLLDHLHLTSISQGIKLLTENWNQNLELIWKSSSIRINTIFYSTGCKYHGKMALKFFSDDKNLSLWQGINCNYFDLTSKFPFEDHMAYCPKSAMNINGSSMNDFTSSCGHSPATSSHRWIPCMDSPRHVSGTLYGHQPV